MTLSQTDVLLTGAAALLASRWLYDRYSRTEESKFPLPPGPAGWPLIGNLADIPKEEAPWKGYYLELSRKHDSDIVRLNLAGTNLIIVNSFEIASDLFDKRSSNYSDRRTAVMLNELCGFHWGMGFRRYGTEWRDSRKAFHQEFHPEAVKRFHSAEVKATNLLLQKLLREPDNFLLHIRHMAGEIIMRVAYGIETLPEEDPYIALAERGLQPVVSTTNAGAYLVDFIPALKYLPEWFPGAGFQKEAKAWKKEVDDMLHVPFDHSKRLYASGEAPPDCAATSLLDGLKTAKDPAYYEKIITAVAGTMYAAGADTTFSTIGSFILAMVLHPDVQEKAQKDIDQLLGMSRLPEITDRPSLPYVQAIVNELLRWAPVVPLAIPHVASEDDVYNGYFIPKGTIVIGNSWAVLHNERDYPEPSRFNPDRFMKDGKLNKEVRDPATAAFGYGRRICPGRYMASDSVFIAISCILANFTISKAVDANGVPITPAAEFDEGFITYPKNFPCQIRPRSKEHVSMIQAASA